MEKLVKMRIKRHLLLYIYYYYKFQENFELFHNFEHTLKFRVKIKKSVNCTKFIEFFDKLLQSFGEL